MGKLEADLQMELCVSLILFLVSLPAFLAKEVGHASVVVDGTVAIAHIDNNFVCATLDWWNHEKCDYNHCPWGSASVLNLVKQSEIPVFGSSCQIVRKTNTEFGFLFARTCLILCLPSRFKVCQPILIIKFASFRLHSLFKLESSVIGYYLQT